MDLKELQIKSAEVLGVSNSQRELAFDTFIEKVSECLTEGITLKVPGIGFFQLKVNNKSNSKSIIFSPLSEDFTREMKNFYLTIEVAQRWRYSAEFDSNVFSIGVGKPLLPLSIDDLPNSETSHTMLKKSIEERARELISESDQIPNFDLFEDYYKFGTVGNDQEKEIDITLTSLTSDPDIIKVVDTESEPENPPEPFADDMNILGSLLEGTSFEEDNPEKRLYGEGRLLTGADETAAAWELGDADKNFEDGPIEEERMLPDYKPDVTLAELLGESNPAFVQEENKNSIPEEESPVDSEEPKSTDTVNIETFLNDKRDKPVLTGPGQEESSHPVDLSPTEEGKRNSDLDSFRALDKTIDELKKSELPPVNETAPGTGSVPYLEDPGWGISEPVIAEPVIEEIPEEKRLDLRMLLDTDKSRSSGDDELWEKDEGVDEKIEWNWGDELKEEFGLKHIEGDDANFEMVDNRNSEIVSAEEKKAYKDLFDQLEKTIEIEKTSFEEDFRIPDNEPEPVREREIEKKGKTTRSKEEEKVYLEFSSPPQKYEFIEDGLSGGNKKIPIGLSSEEYAGTGLGGIMKVEPPVKEKNDNYFGKIFLIIFSAFIFISAAVYFFLRSGSDQKLAGSNAGRVQSAQSLQNQLDSIIQAQVKSSSSAKDSVNPVTEDLGEFPATATPPIPIKNDSKRADTGPLLNQPVNKKEIALKKDKSNSKQPEKVPKKEGAKEEKINTAAKTETRISNKIYFDGTYYYVQISSWPSKVKAEGEVRRLKSAGMKPFIVEAYLPQKGGTWYRVRAGSFKSEKEAQDFINKNNI